MNTPETDAFCASLGEEGDWEKWQKTASFAAELELQLAEALKSAEHAKAYKRALKAQNEKFRLERNKARQEAQDFRDGMGAYLTEGPAEFSWEGTKL